MAAVCVSQRAPPNQYILKDDNSKVKSHPEWLAACKEAAAGSNVAGMFDCQGELEDSLLEVARASDDPEFRNLAEVGAGSKGQPDAERLARARAFAQEMIG